VVVSTLGTIYSVDEENETGLKQAITQDQNMSFPVAMSLLIFILLYTPCMTVIGTLWQELGWKWGAFGVVYPTLLAWILAFFTYNLALFFS